MMHIKQMNIWYLFIPIIVHPKSPILFLPSLLYFHMDCLIMHNQCFYLCSKYVNKEAIPSMDSLKYYIFLISLLVANTVVFGSTDFVSQTFPPITQLSPIVVSPPKIFAPE